MTGVYDITDNGRFMVGHAINPEGSGEAFYLDLGLRGDFNNDETLDIDDLNSLADAIRVGENDLAYDVDYSSTVDASDLEFWVRDLKRTYFGDANLDGQFNSTDFTSKDMITAFLDGGYEQGPRGVPEPSSTWLLLIGVLLLTSQRRNAPLPR